MNRINEILKFREMIKSFTVRELKTSLENKEDIYSFFENARDYRNSFENRNENTYTNLINRFKQISNQIESDYKGAKIVGNVNITSCGEYAVIPKDLFYNLLKCYYEVLGNIEKQ